MLGFEFNYFKCGKKCIFYKSILHFSSFWRTLVKLVGWHEFTRILCHHDTGGVGPSAEWRAGGGCGSQ